MDMLTRDDLNNLLTEHRSPCVSVFMPCHRGGAEEDRIRWRNHLVEAEDRLTTAGSHATEIKELLRPGQRLLEDSSFWKNQSDGLAAFFAPNFLRVFRLPLAFQDKVVVANRFTIIPLLPLVSGNGRFFVLALSQKAVRLLEGTRDTVSEIDLKGVPQNPADALLTHEAKEPFSFYGRRAGEGAGSCGVIFHGHGVGIDDSKEELLHYFQKIDRGLHPLFKEEKAPLVLAAVEYLQPIYRQANTYGHLLEQGVDGNPDRLSSRQLHDRAWPLVKPLFDDARHRATGQYRQLAGSEHASANLETVLTAAYEGRVETLFVALGHQVWGVFDSTTPCIEIHKEVLFGDADLLDLATAHTLKHGGMVYALESDRLPSDTKVAAVFRHPLPKHGNKS